MVVTNRRTWINGKAWNWNVERDRWKEEMGETEEESEEERGEEEEGVEDRE